MPTRSKGTLEYDSNNSGGSWWLNDDDWKNLEQAGWEVAWRKDMEDQFGMSPDGRFLGALATTASKEFNTAGEGVEEWEKITGQSSADEGCNCCGQPHNFSWTGADGSVKYMNIVSGPSSVSWS